MCVCVRAHACGTCLLCGSCAHSCTCLDTSLLSEAVLSFKEVNSWFNKQPGEPQRGAGALSADHRPPCKPSLLPLIVQPSEDSPLSFLSNESCSLPLSVCVPLLAAAHVSEGYIHPSVAASLSVSDTAEESPHMAEPLRSICPELQCLSPPPTLQTRASHSMTASCETQKDRLQTEFPHAFFYVHGPSELLSVF